MWCGLVQTSACCLPVGRLPEAPAMAWREGSKRVRNGLGARLGARVGARIGAMGGAMGGARVGARVGVGVGARVEVRKGEG